MSTTRSHEPITTAYLHIVRTQQAKLHNRAELVRASTDVEAVHRLRVTARRLRSAFRLMRDHFPADSLRTLRSFARDLAHALGAVRDLDVTLAHLDAYIAALPGEEQPAFAPLVRDWREQRARAYWDLLALLNGEEFRGWMAELAHFADQSPGDDAPPVWDAVPPAVWQQYAVVRRYETSLADAPLPVFHALRIEAKRLRYVLEFFQKELGADGDKAIQGLEALQEALGSLHDAAMIEERLTQTAAVQHERIPAAALAGYRAALSAQLGCLRADALAGFATVSARPFRASLALALARL